MAKITIEKVEKEAKPVVSKKETTEKSVVVINRTKSIISVSIGGQYKRLAPNNSASVDKEQADMLVNIYGEGIEVV